VYIYIYIYIYIYTHICIYLFFCCVTPMPSGSKKREPRADYAAFTTKTCSLRRRYRCRDNEPCTLMPCTLQLLLTHLQRYTLRVVRCVSMKILKYYKHRNSRRIEERGSILRFVEILASRLKHDRPFDYDVLGDASSIDEFGFNSRDTFPSILALEFFISHICFDTSLRLSLKRT